MSKRLFAALWTLLALAACTGGINAGGEQPTNNGGMAFIAFTGMLVVTVIVLYILLGRGD